MDDDSPAISGALTPPPPVSAPANSMNDTAMNMPAPPTRRNTLTSDAGSEKTDTCRICRSEGTPDEPLFYPCKCSGSIKFVHQECLMEWLSHSHKKHCELCKTPFRFTKLYDANMPHTLPWMVFMKRACLHVVLTLGRTMRSLLVGFVWLVLIPWVIRWVWRWLFWVADAAWAREDLMRKMSSQSLELQQRQEQKTYVEGLASTMATAFHHFFDPELAFNQTGEPLVYTFASTLAGNLGFSSNLTTPSSADSTSFTLPQADPSILSSWTYLATLTPDSGINRLMLDIIEGQLITCVVITGFILVFLIREWVVQQQPLVNLDNLGNVQQQLREAAERVQADNERLRRQHELLEQARGRLVELQNDSESYGVSVEGEAGGVEASMVEFVGWERLEQMIEEATGHLRGGGADGQERFQSQAQAVTKQIRAAGSAGLSLDEFTDKVYQKLADYDDEVRREWEATLVNEIAQAARHKKRNQLLADLTSQTAREDDSHAETSSSPTRRPPMPERDFSSRATQIQRLLTEAEDIVKNDSNGNPLPRRVDPQPLTESPSVVSAPASESLQQVTSPDSDVAAETDRSIDKDWDKEPLPIANAGPDWRVNIKRGGKGKMRQSPKLKIEEKMLSDDELTRRLEEEVAKEINDENDSRTEDNASLVRPAHIQDDQPVNNNPFHPDGPPLPPPERRNSESFGNRVASVFREEFGLDEAEELESFRQANREPVSSDQNPGTAQPERQPKLWERVADWFWGDIRPPAPLVEEPETEREEAAFVPVQDGQPAIAEAPAPPAEPEPQPQNDPEVVAAAQQAGLDPEAVEDAEDLEGILELIGLQGPLIGLFQTSAFLTLIVCCTILGAVILPYIGGKIILSLAGSPLYYAKVLLQSFDFIAHFAVDLTTVLAGWSFGGLILATSYLLLAVQQWLSWPTGAEASRKLAVFVIQTALSAGVRLQDLFLTNEPPPTHGLGWTWAFLGWSVHAHASLKSMQAEVDAVLGNAGAAVTSVVETISNGSVFEACKRSLGMLSTIPELPSKLSSAVIWMKDYTQPAIDIFTNLSKGALTFSSPEVIMDPSLVYWNSTDRSLAILTGYGALAALAAIYVAADTPLTKSESGRKTEKMIRDTLRQAGGVLKVILIISIEMLVFPLYCGMLLDVAFLPLFQGASMARRWAFAVRHPYTFCFVHWFVGTCYMFHFALFVGMCRKILRKGVLWFIRDPDDPTFHPVRDVLERNVATQLRKIAFSALVYGALVILCLGGVIWSIGRVFEDVFPIHWFSTEPILEFPLDLMLYNFVTPVVIRLFKPSDAVNAMYAWWLRRCARVLRLSHFLFDDRRRDEEGHIYRKSWASFLTMKQMQYDEATGAGVRFMTDADEKPEVYFKIDGRYVLTPCNDQYRPPKPGEAYVYVSADNNDVYIGDKDGRKNDHFAKVYVPPLFQLRVTLFMVCLWMFSAVAGLCATLVPLVFGRRLFASVIPEGIRVNDIYAYTVGSYILGAVLFVAMRGKSAAAFVQKSATKIDVQAFVQPVKRFATKALKCGYVYGFLGVVLPVVFALLLQFYLILPMHTWAASVSDKAYNPMQNSAWLKSVNTTASQDGSDAASSFHQTQLPNLAEHTFHILQDYALGLLYVRMATRFVGATTTASRAAEAFRRITADGYLNPNIRLATRFFVLPVTLLCAFVLLFPPFVARLAIAASNSLAPDLFADEETQIKLYRYSYPLAASCVLLVLGAGELGKATSRWRTRIRDEVYLVGERLHNFGEKKPPAGSKSVVRKEK